MYLKIHVIEISVLFPRKILLRVQKIYLIAMFFEEKKSLVPVDGTNFMVPYPCTWGYLCNLVNYILLFFYNLKYFLLWLQMSFVRLKCYFWERWFSRLTVQYKCVTFLVKIRSTNEHLFYNYFTWSSFGFSYLWTYTSMLLTINLRRSIH